MLPNISSRVNRTRTPAPFPVHRWAEFLPDVAVLPTTAEQVSGVLKLANRLRIPVVPRAGGTGLADGAVPLKGGILVDVKLMNQIKEIDLTDRTVTVGTGINMLKLNEELRPHGVFYPDDPASYPCSIVGGRIGTGGWSLLGGRFGHTRDLVISMEFVLPDRRDHRGRRRRRAQAAQVLHRLHAQAAVHGPPGHAGHRHRGHARARQPARDPVLGLLRLRRLHEGVPHDGADRPLRESPRWPAWCCSTSGSCATCAATTRRTSSSPRTSRRWWRSRCTASGSRSSRRAS